jgi:hypothetical protein
MNSLFEITAFRKSDLATNRSCSGTLMDQVQSPLELTGLMCALTSHCNELKNKIWLQRSLTLVHQVLDIYGTLEVLTFVHTNATKHNTI